MNFSELTTPQPRRRAHETPSVGCADSSLGEEAFVKEEKCTKGEKQ